MDWLATLQTWLRSFSQDPDSLQLGYAILLGASVFLLALALYLLGNGLLDPLRKRVHAVGDRDVRSKPKGGGRGGFLESLGAILTPKSESKRASIQDMLRYAGLRGEGALQVFYGIKLVATVAGPLAVSVLAAVTRALPTVDAFLYVLLAGILGFLIPDIVLKRLARRRQDRLRRGLPDAMDLLVVCSEAGLGLNAGIQRVAGELSLIHPELADELALFGMQSRAGMDNRSALKDLEERTGLEDIQALVTMLLQSMRFGTSIADTLRIYSAELRDKRLQRAEEKAARISTLMIFPLAFCIMPSFLLVVLGPAILGAIDALSGSGLGVFGGQ
jgi:tight adherence protein C